MAEPSLHGASTRRAAVVCRHPATLRQVAQALGVAGLGMRQAIGPAFLPRSARGEFECVVLDLDIDPEALPRDLVDGVIAACPATPVLALAGVNPRQRLVHALTADAVVGIIPKPGTWPEGASPQTPPTDGADEQEVGVVLRRLSQPATVPTGPIPYLLGGTTVEERVVGSSAEKETVLTDVMRFAERFSFSDEKLRRIEMVADELLVNAIFDAPRDEAGEPRYHQLDRRAPLTLPAQAQVRIRWGCDARNFALSVADRFGALDRRTVASHIARALEAQGPRPPGSGSGAGLGLVLCFASSNQLVVHGAPGKFTEVTSVVHVAGSNRATTSKGCALHMFL